MEVDQQNPVVQDADEQDMQLYLGVRLAKQPYFRLPLKATPPSKTVGAVKASVEELLKLRSLEMGECATQRKPEMQRHNNNTTHTHQTNTRHTQTSSTAAASSPTHARSPTRASAPAPPYTYSSGRRPPSSRPPRRPTSPKRTSSPRWRRCAKSPPS